MAPRPNATAGRQQAYPNQRLAPRATPSEFSHTIDTGAVRALVIAGVVLGFIIFTSWRMCVRRNSRGAPSFSLFEKPPILLADYVKPTPSPRRGPPPRPRLEPRLDAVRDLACALFAPDFLPRHRAEVEITSCYILAIGSEAHLTHPSASVYPIRPGAQRRVLEPPRRGVVARRCVWTGALFEEAFELGKQ